MKKKIVAVILAVMMVFGLAACTGSADSPNNTNAGTDVTSNNAVTDTGTTNPDTANDASAADSVPSSDEVYNIHMQIVTFGAPPTGAADVEQAINKITEPKIGVTVTLEPVAAWDLARESTLKVTSGEQLDLLCILPFGAGMDAIVNYTSKNMLLPLDDLYAEYGKDIAPVIGSLINIGYSGGSLYAIPPNYLMGFGNGFVARTDILNELGFNFSADNTYTIQDLEELFDAYKEKYGDGNYAIASYATANIFSTLYPVDTLGTDNSDGVLMDGGLGNNIKVENLFATEQYKEFTNKMHDWYGKGYFNPDVTTITDDWGAQLATGSYLGALTSISGNGLDSLIVNELGTGFKLTPIKIVPDYATTGSASMGLWAIPITCANPEKTMQFLNLMYQEQELENDIDSLLAVGLEGSTYQIVERVGGSKIIVDYVEGVNDGNSPFQQRAPIYGNQFTIPKFTPMTAHIYDDFAVFNQNLEKNNRLSQAFGYAFDPSVVSSQKVAVQNVVSQYGPLLNFGSVDPEKVLPQFLQELEDAGMNALITENQRQLDEWLSNR